MVSARGFVHPWTIQPKQANCIHPPNHLIHVSRKTFKNKKGKKKDRTEARKQERKKKPHRCFLLVSLADWLTDCRVKWYSISFWNSSYLLIFSNTPPPLTTSHLSVTNWAKSDPIIVWTGIVKTVNLTLAKEDKLHGDIIIIIFRSISFIQRTASKKKKERKEYRNLSSEGWLFSLYIYFSLLISIYIYIYIYHHHHVVLLARISLTLSRHFSLSFIASGRSSGLHPVSSHAVWLCQYYCMDAPYGHSHNTWRKC